MQPHPRLNPRVASLAAAVTLLLPVAAPAAVDFTPRFVEITNDGYTTRALSLRRDAQTVFLTTPPSWTVSGNPASLTLVCPDIPQAQIVLGAPTVLPPPPTAEFDPKWVEEARAKLLKSLPKEAVDTTVENHPQPINFNGWKTYELTVNYNYFGDRLQKSVCFIRLRTGESVELTALARKGNFEQVHGFAMQMAGSWTAPPAGRLAQMLSK